MIWVIPLHCEVIFYWLSNYIRVGWTWTLFYQDSMNSKKCTHHVLHALACIVEARALLLTPLSTLHPDQSWWSFSFIECLLLAQRILTIEAHSIQYLLIIIYYQSIQQITMAKSSKAIFLAAMCILFCTLGRTSAFSLGNLNRHNKQTAKEHILQTQSSFPISSDKEQVPNSEASVVALKESKSGLKQSLLAGCITFFTTTPFASFADDLEVAELPPPYIDE